MKPATGTPPVGLDRHPGVDGLRAVAALWVLLFHMRAFSGGSLWPGLDFVARSGSAGVSLFLVLSGFCLYVPYAGGRLTRFHTRQFLQRRMRRLLPAYFASLAAVLLLHLGTGGRLGLPRLDGVQIWQQGISHLTLSHQLFPSTFYGLNGAYWSLGLEWELYLTLPLLVIAVARYGIWKTVGAVFAVTIAYRMALAIAGAGGLLSADGPWATVVLPNFFLGRWSEFASGMAAAQLYRTGRIGQRPGLLALVAITSGVLGALQTDSPLSHVMFGLVFFALLALVLSGGNVVARALSWRPLVALGVMSYSFYLVHQPLVEVLASGLGAGRDGSPRVVFLQLVALTPVILLAAVLMFVTVERRTLTRAGAPRVPVRHLLFPPVAYPRTPLVSSRGGSPQPADVRE